MPESEKPKVVLVTTVAGSQEVVRHVLMHEKFPVIGVVCKRQFYDGPLVMLMLATCSGKIYHFDVKRHPELVIQGSVIRLLQSVHLKKVFHDCHRDAAALFHQFGIRMQNVFDTQIAYAVHMKDEGLTPRFISLRNLYEKFCTENSLNLIVSRNLMDEPVDPGLYWAQRPLNVAMFTQSAVAAAALLAGVYEAMKSCLKPESIATFDELCEDAIRIPSRRRSASHPPRTSSYRPPINQFTGYQWKLLERTIPSSVCPSGLSMI